MVSCFIFQSKFERDLIIVFLAFSICIPNVFIFLESLMKSVFGNKPWPTFGTIFVVGYELYFYRNFIG